MATSGVGSEHELGAVMSELARTLHEEHGDIEGTLQAITTAAVATITAATDCGISLVRERTKVEPRAWTSDLPRELDTLQGELGQGPCLDAVWDEQVVRVQDMSVETRWPVFAARAVQAGAGSMLCFQLFVAENQLGALNLYSPTADDLGSDEDVDLGRMLASHAAIALAGAQYEQHLQIGLTHRDTIGQAKGILMERHKLTAGQAFEVLVRSSSVTNRKLHDIAEELAATGELPTARR